MTHHHTDRINIIVLYTILYTYFYTEIYPNVLFIIIKTQ